MRAKNTELRSIPLHIERSQQDGRWFARCPEFDIVTHGDTELHAAKNLFEMMQRSLFVAASTGDLERILKKAGVELVVGLPPEARAVDQDKLWYLPVSSNAHTLAVT